MQQLNAAERQTLDEALKDRVKTRDPRTVPETCRPVVLVAAGDSLTAAHHQTANHLQHCESTESDPVRPAPMKGNNSAFSYAGKYFDANRQIVEYYNFARTGFSTKDILAAGPDDVDGCNQPWSRHGFPIDLAKSAVEQAKRNQHAAWFVTTGGINDTNWVDVMSQTLVCRALETTRRDRDPRRFTWTANNGGGRADIVPHGGTCIATAALLGEIHREVVPRFDGKFDSVSLRAKRIVDTMLQAGADRVIWMLYYDLNPARIQIRHLVERQIAQRGAGFFDINRMGEVIEVVDPDWAAASRDIRNQLNLAIIKQLPQNLSRAQWSKVRIVAPYLETAEIQQTARGGSPHPNEAGHQKLAKLLDNAANAPGTGKALRSKVNNRYVAAGHGGDQPLIARSAFPGPWESFEFIRVGGTDAKPHVALLSLANHNFVAAEQAGAQPLIANRAVRGAWETFELSRNADDGTISLKSLANNKFVTATNAGNGPLLASCGGAECPALWERFYETPSPSGYALRARVNTKHVTVPNLQGGPLYASEAADGPTTTFHVLDVRHPELDRTKRFVALMSHTNNRFVTAVEAGTKPLMAAVPERPNMWKEELGKIRWEIFEVYSNADGSISLRALANNKFVTAQDAGNGPLLAARGEATPDAWEKFDLIPWNTPPEHLP